MAQKSLQEKCEESLWDAAENAKTLAKRIREKSATLYTDGMHKQVTAEIAALNVQQNAVGKIMLVQSIISRVGMTELRIADAQEKAKALPRT